MSRFNLLPRSPVDEDGFVNKRSGYEIGNVIQSIDLSRRRKSDRSFIATTVSVNFLGL